MPSARRRIVTAALVLLAIASQAAALDIEVSTYTLPNGLTVILHPDHTLPQVVVNSWFAVGSKDEKPGRSGFAHLFEHLMFMGTERVPGSEYDIIMERGGGTNNASTNTDRTNYYSWGPSSLLPTLLWLDADRLDGLGRAMTQDKLDLQRDVVRNERRQNYENTPYNKAYLIIPEALYPEGHPYHYSTIGNHEDLEAATLDDVKEFFDTYYVPGNASLVVAGDFDPDVVREIIAGTFGAVPPRPLPEHRTAPPVVLEREIRRLALDRVESPRLHLVWPSPPAFGPGDAETDLAADILGDGPSSRLHRRLVLSDRLARDVAAFNWSRELGSELHIRITARPDGDLEHIKRIVLEEVARFTREGPTPAELARVIAAQEASFLRQVENLLERADMLNDYRHVWGDPASFDRDLVRYTSATADGVRRWAAAVLGEGRLDLRILPEDATVEGADLDHRPADLPPADYRPPVPTTVTLANGVPLHVLQRPGSGLFSGALIVNGGERLVPPGSAGLAGLAASMLTAGAGGRSAADFADAVATLGAEIEADSSWHDLTVAVSGLTSRLEATLDLFADAVLRPNLTAEDFARERDLALDEIRSRPESPPRVAFDVSRSLLFGRDDPRGRPGGGYEETVQDITLEGLTGFLPRLLDPARAQLVFVGDIEPSSLKTALDRRLGAWTRPSGAAAELPAPITEAAPGRLVLVDRPGAPQTFIAIARPLAGPASDTDRAVLHCLTTLLGGTFTSRLMHNLREQHGYTYGARSQILETANQLSLLAYASVQTEVTGAALGEFKAELDRLTTGDVTADELEKAVQTVRYELTATAETTGSLADTLVEIAADGRTLDAVGRELEALGRVDIDLLNAAARSGIFGWDSQLVVMVGDANAVLPQLAGAGFARPALVDERGDPLAAD